MYKILHERGSSWPGSLWMHRNTPTQPGQTPPKELRSDPTQTQLTWQINASPTNAYGSVPKPPHLRGSPSPKFGSKYTHPTNTYTKCNIPDSCAWNGFTEIQKKESKFHSQARTSLLVSTALWPFKKGFTNLFSAGIITKPRTSRRRDILLFERSIPHNTGCKSCS